MIEKRVRLGAVGYLNARPLVFGLERSARFSLRFDVPSECAELLHRGGIDVGLVPSIEYLRGDYRIVPEAAIASRGPVKSVVLFTRKPIAAVRSIAMDTSSRTSVALTRVLCARAFGIRPSVEAAAPDLPSMLARSDAGLIIGDVALFLDDVMSGVQKIDLGEAWTSLTGLPFVYAFWAGRAGTLTGADVETLQRAGEEGARRAEEVAGAYFEGSPVRQATGAAYLRDNIKYRLGPDERAGLELFYRYAAEADVVPSARELRFF
jgi:chorismate dehydratase